MAGAGIVYIRSNSCPAVSREGHYSNNESVGSSGCLVNLWFNRFNEKNNSANMFGDGTVCTGCVRVCICAQVCVCINVEQL